MSCCPALVDVLEELPASRPRRRELKRWRVGRHPRPVSCVMDHVGRQAHDRHAPPREPPTGPSEEKGRRETESRTGVSRLPRPASN
jgi:hypothetical protein